MNLDPNQTYPESTCPVPEDVLASVMDPQSLEHLAGVQQHVDSCAECRAIAQEARATVESLQSEDGHPVSDDFLKQVLNRIPEDEWVSEQPTKDPVIPWRPSPVLKVAMAACLVGLCVLVLKLGAPAEGDEPKDLIVDASIHAGTRWVLEYQQEHGGWDVRDLGGRDNYAPALNGLAVLALTRSGLEPEQINRPVQNAAHYLIQLQGEDGRFGEVSEGVMYNQGIASLAVLEAFELTRDKTLVAPIQLALDYIVSQQTLHGGWGYGTSEDGRPNTSITAWQVQSLLLAKKLGVETNHQPLRKGLAWLSSTVNSSGYFGYEKNGPVDKDKQTLTMMGALCLLTAEQQEIPVDQPVMKRVATGIESISSSMPGDYYASYFYASALSIADPEAYKVALAQARSSLETRQLSGANGAWDYDDRWGSAGGQIYSTSMALMSLLQNSSDEQAH